MHWKVNSVKTVLTTIPFQVEELSLQEEGQVTVQQYHRLALPDWVNILPVTSDGRAVLVRQDRVGPEKSVLETPGGVVDAHEQRDPTVAAVRELEEETGYTTQRLLPLLAINPNPAIQTNRIHFFLGLNCYLNPDRQHFPDASEHLRVELVPLAELDSLVRTGRIDHALSALCIMLAAKYVTIQPSEATSP